MVKFYKDTAGGRKIAETWFYSGSFQSVSKIHFDEQVYLELIHNFF